MLENIDEIVRLHRKKGKLTQMGLANLAGVGKSCVWDLEHKAKNIRLGTLIKILKVLNINLKIESSLMSLFEVTDEKS